jgi:hypothetical protein
MTSSGAVDAESSVRTLYMRNRSTGQTAECRVSNTTYEVVAVTLTQAASPSPQPAPVPSPAPGNSSSGRPVAPTDPSATLCMAAMGTRIRGDFANVEKLNYLTDTTQSYFISNAEEGIRGEGQFYQSSDWHRFSYDCTVNIRNGTVTSISYKKL